MNRKQFLKNLAWMQAGVAGAGLMAFRGFEQLAFSNNHVTYYRANSPEYDLLRQGFNKRISRKPKIIALCNDAEGVQQAINYARSENLAVTVKSGGHCMEGFSVSDDGMVINLSKLNSISWLDDQTVKLGPAVLLKDLYTAILPRGRYMPGGSCQSVAVSGLSLGGGYGLLSRQFGLTCDSLTDLSLIDGNGNPAIITDEIRWACRGGGNGNFGVITSLTFKLQKAPAIMQSFRLRYRQIPVTAIKPLLKSWFEVSVTLPKDCFSAIIINHRTAYILITSTRRDISPIQSQLNALKAVTKTFEHSKPKLLQDALKTYYGQVGPLYFKNASAGLYKSFMDIDGCLDGVIEQIRKSPGMIYQVNTLGGAVQNPEFENASSFPYRSYPFFSELQAYYENPAQAPKLLESFENIQLLFEAQGINAQYRNYPDLNFKNPLSLYYGQNLERLQKIKQQLDPLNIIRHPQSII